MLPGRDGNRDGKHILRLQLIKFVRRMADTIWEFPEIRVEKSDKVLRGWLITKIQHKMDIFQPFKLPKSLYNDNYPNLVTN